MKFYETAQRISRAQNSILKPEFYKRFKVQNCIIDQNNLFNKSNKQITVRFFFIRKTEAVHRQSIIWINSLMDK
jgi:hypothetical protein